MAGRQGLGHLGRQLVGTVGPPAKPLAICTCSSTKGGVYGLWVVGPVCLCNSVLWSCFRPRAQPSVTCRRRQPSNQLLGERGQLGVTILSITLQVRLARCSPLHQPNGKNQLHRHAMNDTSTYQCGWACSLLSVLLTGPYFVGQDPGHLALCFKSSPCRVHPGTRHSDTAE